MINILFIGDIVGSVGRKAVSALLPGLKEEFSIDLVIANGENAAHGKGLTLTTAQELLSAGIDWMTTGDHCFDQSSNIEACFNNEQPILRPANYSSQAPGRGYSIISTAFGDILLMNVIGRSFMSRDYDSPFEKYSEIMALFTDKKFSAIIIDIHAEATSEKIAFRHFVDGTASVLIGTHTHVQTADNCITPAGTGYVTDAGMTGFADGVIGVEKEPVLHSFLTQIKQPQRLPESGKAILSGVIATIDPATSRCQSIQPIQRFISIQ
jgi:metallophosphoesterase (TIGR00282 family)